MTKERLSVLICGALLFTIPSSVFAVKPGGSNDITVGTIYFVDGTSQSTATLQGPAGTQGPTGPTGPQGPAGANGYNSLMLITDELSGSNCANGGIKIQVGLDQDRSGVLDSCEVLQTQYMCNGTTAVSPTPTPIKVTASPSTQTAKLFTDITATVKNADGTPGYGSVYFTSSGSCMLYGADNSPSNFASVYVTAGIASVALTNTNSSGGPCVVYAGSYNPSTQVQVGGSALATFVP